MKKQISRKNQLCPELSRDRSFKSNLQLTSMIRKTSEVFSPFPLKLNPKDIYTPHLREDRKYPNLFGTAKELEKLVDIEAACLTFNVCITGEEFE